MMEIDKLTLKDLQPSQFYISGAKLSQAENWFDPDDLSSFEAIPVKLLDGIPDANAAGDRERAEILEAARTAAEVNCRITNCISSEVISSGSTCRKRPLTSR